MAVIVSSVWAPLATRADVPDAGGAVVGALAGRRPTRRSARPAAGRSPARRWRRPGRCWSAVTVKVIVSPTLGVASLTVLVTSRSACLRSISARVGVVARVRVELVGVGDRRRVRLRVGADDQGRDRQRLRPVDQDRADGPDPGDRVVVPLAGHGGDEGARRRAAGPGR